MYMMGNTNQVQQGASEASPLLLLIILNNTCISVCHSITVSQASLIPRIYLFFSTLKTCGHMRLLLDKIDVI